MLMFVLEMNTGCITVIYCCFTLEMHTDCKDVIVLLEQSILIVHMLLGFYFRD